jgi:hypothetical protein
MSRAGYACDTDALCQGRTGTCWYVATVTFMWKSQDFLRDECGIEFNESTKKFLELTVEQCKAEKQIGPGSEECLMLPPGVETVYRKRGIAPTLESGGSAINLLVSFFIDSNVRVFYSRRPPQEWQIKHAFREFDVVVIDKLSSALGITEDKAMSDTLGPIIMLSIMAEARETPQTHVLVGAIVRVQHPNGLHAIAIVRCKSSSTNFMICDSATGQCYDGARETTFEYGKLHGTIIKVSFVYAKRKALFADMAFQ